MVFPTRGIAETDFRDRAALARNRPNAIASASQFVTVQIHTGKRFRASDWPERERHNGRIVSRQVAEPLVGGLAVAVQ